MARLSFKKTAVIIVILSCFGDLVKSQKDEKTEVRSLGHRRGGYVGEQTVYVDRPYFLEQPVYYSYPYQYQYQYPAYTYQYPYAYSYQYPYGVPGYPYNYSYTYTRTTSRPGGIVTRPVGYVSPLPYAPLPPPYLRYLGNETSSDRKLDIFVPEDAMMRPSFINDISPIFETEMTAGNHTQSNKHTTSTSESGNSVKNDNEVTFGGCLLSPNKTDLSDAKQDNVDGDKTDAHAPEMMHNSSISNLRILAKKGLIERVEEKVGDVFDGIKKKMTNKDDKLSGMEKEDDSNAENHDNNENSESGDHNKTQGGSKMIKQVFNTIEDIVSTTLNK